MKDYLNAGVPILASSMIGDKTVFRKYNIGYSLESNDFRKELLKIENSIRNLIRKDEAKFDDFYIHESSLDVSIKKYSKLYGSLS